MILATKKGKFHVVGGYMDFSFCKKGCFGKRGWGDKRSLKIKANNIRICMQKNIKLKGERKATTEKNICFSNKTEKKHCEKNKAYILCVWFSLCIKCVCI